MGESPLFHDQLLATKFFIPSSSHALIPRPRLIELLNMSLERPLSLLSAPAGFGKTTLLSTWIQSLPPERPRIAWVSLDEGDNEPVLFWTYVLTALDSELPGLCTELITYLQTQQAPPLRSVLQTLINRLAERSEQLLLILDDYHLVTEQAIHTSLTYLVEHLPPQLHFILATRADPPLPISLLRARGRLLEVRTDELRCSPDEVMDFLKKSASIQLSQDMVEAVTIRTEGWLVGLQLLGLSMQGHADPGDLLEEVSGSQRYIFDYLIEEVFQSQSASVQTFLLHTSILKRLSAPLCDAILEQSGSQQHGIGVLVYGPLAHGLLAGAFTPQTTFAADDWRSKSEIFHGDIFQRNLAVVEQLKRLAEHEGMTVAQLAIAWVLAGGKQQPAIDVAIIGARNPEQLEQTAPAGDIHLTQATLQEIERIMREAVPIGGPAPEGM